MSSEERETSEMGAEATGEDTILELRDTSVSFDMARGESRVLDSVDMDIRRGEILGVVGESGSGKSMFASALLDAIVEPGVLSGEITYYPEDGDEIDLLSLSKKELRHVRWEEIAMVFQGAMSSWNATMTIGEHFRETLDVHNHDRKEGMERARQLLSDLYLEADRVLRSYPHELSGGMKQRALIALSLVLEPEVLVLDEPTAALDLLMQRSIISLLDTIQDEHDLTIVFITHDLELVADLADRLAVMYAFEFAELGPSREVMMESKHPYTRALINSTPNLDTPVNEMEPIIGESPDSVDVPSGCSYHPRCPLADGQCRENDPGLNEVNDKHSAACHYWDEVEEKIPLNVNEYHPQESPESDADTADPVSDRRVSDETVVELDDTEVHFEESQGFLDSLFNDPDPIRAVDGVSLDINESDVVALVGESGCGKTTLGKASIGIHRPTGGSVSYRGQDIWDAKEKRNNPEIPYKDIRRSLQIIHQDPGSALNPNKTVETILSAPLEVWEDDMTFEDRKASIHSLLDRVGMSPAEDYAARYPHQLSGGETQRVALIRAMFMNPDLILADEPISALDVSLRVDMMNLMLELQEQFDTSFLFISHNLSNARYLTAKTGGRIGIMYLGELVEIGPADEVLFDPQHPYTKVLKWATPDLDPDSESVEEPPVRDIDVPDPGDPPSGCRFHTRCPEAREACKKSSPELEEIEGKEGQRAACFRACDEDHEYWDSPPITEETDGPSVEETESTDASDGVPSDD